MQPGRAPTKEIKTALPLAHHLRLHRMKIVTGKTFSEAIAEALEAYFAEAAPRPVAPAPRASPAPADIAPRDRRPRDH